MDARSAVPSTGLIRFLNNPCRSDAVVQFLRALAAFHMLYHQQGFEMLQLQFDANEEERSAGTVQQLMCCHTAPCCTFNYLYIWCLQKRCLACM